MSKRKRRPRKPGARPAPIQPPAAKRAPAFKLASVPHFELRWQPALHLPLAGLALLTLAAYWPAFFGDFIWGDNTFLDSPLVSSWGGIVDLWIDPGSAGSASHYWPVLYTSLWLDHKLWGFNPMGFHATNILLHCVNTALLWRLLVRMKVPGAWLVAAFFAIHPMRAEAVAWVIARKDLLATLFYLLAAGRWLRFREAPGAGPYLAMLVFYALGVLSKTVAITLPAVLLVWVWWQHGRIGKRDLLQVAPLFLIGLAIGAYGLQFFTGRTLIEFEYSFAERVIMASKALWFYAGKILWPHPLQYIYNFWDVNPLKPLNWLGLLAALGLTLALWLARHRIGRGPLAAALFFAIALSPMLGFADNSFMKFAYVADRYQYLAGVGLIAVLVVAAVRLCQALDAGAMSSSMPGPPSGAEDGGETGAEQAPPEAPTKEVLGLPFRQSGVIYGASALATLLLAACCYLTIQRAQLLQDKVVLFQDVVANTPGAYEAYYNLGTFLMERDRTEEAVAAFMAGLEHEPFRIKLYVSLGSALQRLERHEEAEDILRRAIARQPSSFDGLQDPDGAKHEAANAHAGLGALLMDLGRLDEAEAAFVHALKLDPNLTHALLNLIGLLTKQGRYEEALAIMQRLAKEEPTVELYFRMAEIASKMGRKRYADNYLSKALALTTDGRTALEQQAATQFKAGSYDEAAIFYQRLIAMMPNHPDYHTHYGTTLKHLERHEEAEQSLKRAKELASGNPAAIGQSTANLSEAQRIANSLSAGPFRDAANHHFDNERYEQALDFYQRTVALDPDDVQAHFRVGITLMRLNRMEEASQTLEGILEVAPSATVIINPLAQIHFNAGRFDKAAELYHRLTTIEPESSDAHANLGAALANLGRLEDAIKSFERAVQLNPENSFAQTNLQRMRQAQNEQQ